MLVRKKYFKLENNTLKRIAITEFNLFLFYFAPSRTLSLSVNTSIRLSMQEVVIMVN